jgi:hypothetical protein
VIIHDSRGNQVYDQKHNNIGAGIVWVWREFMLAELASGNDVRPLIADIRRISILDDVIKLLPANEDSAYILANMQCESNAQKQKTQRRTTMGIGMEA